MTNNPTNNSVRIEVLLAGQKIILATTPENESKLRAAAQLVNDQITQITMSGNRSIERAALMTALKLAGELQDIQPAPPNQNELIVSNAVLEQLDTKLSAIEKQVDIALDCLSLPSSPRSIVP